MVLRAFLLTLNYGKNWANTGSQMVYHHSHQITWIFSNYVEFISTLILRNFRKRLKKIDITMYYITSWDTILYGRCFYFCFARWITFHKYPSYLYNMNSGLKRAVWVYLPIFIVPLLFKTKNLVRNPLGVLSTATLGIARWQFYNIVDEWPPQIIFIFVFVLHSLLVHSLFFDKGEMICFKNTVNIDKNSNLGFVIIWLWRLPDLVVVSLLP